MSAQIVTLYGAPVESAPGEPVCLNEPVPEIIEELEEMLERARAGKIRALAIGGVVIDDDGDVCAQRIMVMPDDEHLYLLLGAARYVLMRVEDECFG